MSDLLPQLKSDARRDGWLDMVRTENDERALLDGCVFIESMGKYVVDFFRAFLRHSKEPWLGKAFEPMLWQADYILRPLFGWIRKDGTRRFRRASIWTAKKTGKTTLMAGCGIYLLVGDGEAAAQVFCAANDRKQAAYIFDEASSMVRQSPALRDRLSILETHKRIRGANGSFLEALSAEHATHEGLNAHAVIIDEIHAFNERARKLREALRYAGAARRQPLEIVISTAGDDDGPGRDEYEVADAIRKGPSGGGIANTDTLVYIAEASPEDDPFAEATWKKANPSLGHTVKLEETAAEAEVARSNLRVLASFKRYRLNLWTRAAEPWLDIEAWKRCAAEVDIAALAGQPCSGGLDCAENTDLAAFVLAFRSGEAARPAYTVMPFFFMAAERERTLSDNDRCDYRSMAAAGHLILTPGPTIDQAFIEHKIAELSKTYKLGEIGFDPFQARYLADRLQTVHGLKMLQFRQGYLSMSNPSMAFESAILDGRLKHTNNPILNRMAAQVTRTVDPAGNIKPTKTDDEKRRRRIDGVVASIMAMDVESRRPWRKKVYAVQWINA